jgi:DNA-directed RNA polymerase specialized sigma24 family protein
MKTFINSDSASRGAIAAHSLRVYASPADFCVIFDQDMDSLYSLALLLTANHKTAEECFVAALEDCRTGSAVFPEWARSWSRRAVIKTAVRLLNPAGPHSAEASDVGTGAILNEMDGAGQEILKLDTSSRLVFVITMLEGYSTRECAALLGWSPREVEQAKVQALQQIASDARNLVPAGYESGPHIDQVPVFSAH